VSFVGKPGSAPAPQYDGMYLWDPARNSLVLWQVNHKGEVLQATVIAGSGTIDQLSTVAHPDGTFHYLKSHLERTNDSTFHFKAFFRPSESAQWQPAVELDYHRRP
jgi:hypothetical protein